VPVNTFFGISKSPTNISLGEFHTLNSLVTTQQDHLFNPLEDH
jgi:hypothetical protein